MVDTLMSRDPAGMPELIEFINDGPTVYLVVFGLVMLDAIFPLAPSETLLVSGGVLVASGDIAIVPLVLAGAAGALAGHVLLYTIGGYAGPGIARRVVRGPDRDVRIAAATRHLERRTWIIIVADFVPWGRTILMFTAGALGLAWRRFLGYASVGAAIWASFYVALGWAGGSVFESTWYGLAASLAMAFVIVAVLEITGRVLRARRGEPIIPDIGGMPAVDSDEQPGDELDEPRVA